MEHSANQITVSLSKKKISNLIVGALSIIAFGFWLILKPESEFDKPYRLLNLSMGCLCILRGLFAVYYSLKKLKSKTPGLIINSGGLQKSFPGKYSEWISWNDINRIRIVNIFWRKVIFLEVNNPKTYIKRQKNPFNKVSMFLDYKIYDSPLKVTTDGLDITFEELYQSISQKFLLYKS